jgi:hypothetical protein
MRACACSTCAYLHDAQLGPEQSFELVSLLIERVVEEQELEWLRSVAYELIDASACAGSASIPAPKVTG